MAPILRLLAALAPIAAMAFVRTDRRLISALRAAGAVGHGTASTLEATSPLARWRLSRLISAGAIRAADAGRYYFDAAGYQRFRHARRRRAMGLLGLVLAAMLVFWALE